MRANLMYCKQTPVRRAELKHLRFQFGQRIGFSVAAMPPAIRKSAGGEKPGTGKNAKSHDAAAVREKHPWIANLVHWLLG